MTLKLKLKSLDGLDDTIKSLYEEKDGEYVLSVDGVEDTGALKRAKDHEKEARKEAEMKVKELQDAMQKIEQQQKDALDKNARENNDVEALEKSWKEKLTQREQELNERIESLSGNINTMLVDNEALKLASKLAVEGSADVLLPHIKSRLGAEMRDGKYVTVVKDKDGKASASTLDDFAKEIASNPAFAPVLAGSKASGGGAVIPNMSGGSSDNVSNVTKQYLTEIKTQ